MVRTEAEVRVGAGVPQASEKGEKKRDMVQKNLRGILIICDS